MPPHILRSRSSVSRWSGPERSYTPDPGEFPSRPGATASTVPLKNTTHSQLQFRLWILASTNTGRCFYKLYVCGLNLDTFAEIVYIVLKLADKQHFKKLYITRFNNIYTLFIKNCNIQTFYFPDRIVSWCICTSIKSS